MPAPPVWTAVPERFSLLVGFYGVLIGCVVKSSSVDLKIPPTDNEADARGFGRTVASKHVEKGVEA